jgi:hypothetical protein
VDVKTDNNNLPGNKQLACTNTSAPFGKRMTDIGSVSVKGACMVRLCQCTKTIVALQQKAGDVPPQELIAAAEAQFSVMEGM